MATLENIWLNKVGDEHELRFDWDNDRHQAIKLSKKDPESVKEALLKAARLLDKEQRTGVI